MQCPEWLADREVSDSGSFAPTKDRWVFIKRTGVAPMFPSGTVRDQWDSWPAHIQQELLTVSLIVRDPGGRATQYQSATAEMIRSGQIAIRITQ